MLGNPSIPRRGLGVSGVLFLLAAAPAIAAGQVPEHARPIVFEPLAAFATRRLGESSGVAVSRAHPGILWTHNDSGDGPFIYATNLEGDDLGRYTVPGARAVDWEDVALGPCVGAPAACLYIADTGDNAEHRPDVSLYIVPEPDPFARPTRSATAPGRRVVVRFEGGPRDVEALAVTPDGTVLLVSKGRHGPVQVFRIDADQLVRDTVGVSAWLELPIDPRRPLGRLVTGAAVAPDGHTLAVRTYTEIFFFSVDGDPGQVRELGWCWLGLVEAQGEGVDFLDDRTLVLTSETARGRRGGISRVECPIRPTGH